MLFRFCSNDGMLTNIHPQKPSHLLIKTSNLIFHRILNPRLKYHEICVKGLYEHTYVIQ